MLRFLRLSIVLLVLAGCSKLNPIAPAPPSAGIRTFVLKSVDDPRLPAPAFEIAEKPEAVTLSKAKPSQDEDPASFWNQTTTDLARTAGLPPPLFARAYALTHVAIYDALAAGADGRRGRLVSGAVAAGAASTVLQYLFPSRADEIAALAAERREPGSESGAAASGFALGRAVGLLVVDYGKQDGSSVPFTGTPPSGPGIWTGTNPVLPMCGTWKCWVIESGEEIQPEPPYAYGSPEDLSDVEAVVQATLHRTPDQIAVVHKWADRPPPAIWNGLLLDRVASGRLKAFESARAFAYLNVAMYDGFVACWACKYTHWTARPFQRIPGLVTVITTPNFPSYTSGHSTISGAAAEVMAELFPGEAGFFRAEAEEAAISRLWGGIHFPRDNDQGRLVGIVIGERVVARMRGDQGQLIASR